MATNLGARAEEAFEQGVNRARATARSAERCAEQALGDLSNEATYRIKRQPLRAVGVAAGAGLLVGIVIGCLGGWWTFSRR